MEREIKDVPRKTPKPQRFLKNNIQGLTRPALKRLGRKAGAKRIGGDVYDEVREAVKNFMDDLIKKSIIFTEHSKRKTVNEYDVKEALRIKGVKFYG